MNPHHMVTPVQQQDTYSYTTRTELSSTGNNELLMMNGLYVDTAVSECTEDTQSIEEPSIRGNGEQGYNRLRNRDWLRSLLYP